MKILFEVEVDKDNYFHMSASIGQLEVMDEIILDQVITYYNDCGVDWYEFLNKNEDEEQTL